MNSSEYSQLKKIIFVIVIFKRLIRDSETYISLEREFSGFRGAKPDLYIYDNSPDAQSIDSLDTFNIIYTHDASNSGVSKAYNMACYKANKIGKDWIMILDQDTTMPVGSLKIYSDALGNLMSGINAIAPKLYSNNILISPCRYLFHHGFKLKEVSSGNFLIFGHSFLNSGLLLNVQAINDVGFYDEALFDYSDHEFFLRFSVKNRFVYVLDVHLAHNFSGSDQGRFEDNVIRFKKLSHASQHIAKKYNSLWPMIWLLFRGLKLSISFKSLFFILYFFKNNFEDI